MMRNNRSVLIFLLSLIGLLSGKAMAQATFAVSSRPALERTVLETPVFGQQPFRVTLSDPWFGRDKVHHFLTSAFLSGVGYYALRDEQRYGVRSSQVGSLMFSISLGLAKEVRDGLKPHNAFSVKDLVADILGAVVGLAIVAD